MRIYRKLVAAEALRLRDHLLRLSPLDRHCRFAGHVSDAVIDSYCRRIPWLGTVVVGCFDDGVLRAAAECRWLGPGQLRSVEVAVTVEPEWQGQGIGTDLVRRVVTIARNRGAASIFMLCLTDNRPMQAIARKLAGDLRFVDGEVEVRIAVPFATNVSLMQEALADLSGAAGMFWSSVVGNTGSTARAAGARH